MYCAGIARRLQKADWRDSQRSLSTSWASAAPISPFSFCPALVNLCPLQPQVSAHDWHEYNLTWVSAAVVNLPQGFTSCTFLKKLFCSPQLQRVVIWDPVTQFLPLQSAPPLVSIHFSVAHNILSKLCVKRDQHFKTEISHNNNSWPVPAWLDSNNYEYADVQAFLIKCSVREVVEVVGYVLIVLMLYCLFWSQVKHEKPPENIPAPSEAERSSTPRSKRSAIRSAMDGVRRKE